MVKREPSLSCIIGDQEELEKSWGDTLNKEIQEFWRLIFEDIQN